MGFGDEKAQAIEDQSVRIVVVVVPILLNSAKNKSCLVCVSLFEHASEHRKTNLICSSELLPQF